MEYKSFKEKELEILRSAVDKATSIVGQKMVQSEDIKKIINIFN